MFLIGHNRSTNQRSGMILEVHIQIFSEYMLIKVFTFKKFQGAQIFKFFVKIGMKLPLHKRTNAEIQI